MHINLFSFHYRIKHSFPEMALGNFSPRAISEVLETFRTRKLFVPRNFVQKFLCIISKRKKKIYLAKIIILGIYADNKEK